MMFMCVLGNVPVQYASFVQIVSALHLVSCMPYRPNHRLYSARAPKSTLIVYLCLKLVLVNCAPKIITPYPLQLLMYKISDVFVGFAAESLGLRIGRASVCSVVSMDGCCETAPVADRSAGRGAADERGFGAGGFD